MTTGDLKCLFEELRGYRNYLDEWVGEQSTEYQMTNCMLVLSRVLSSMSDDSNIMHWIGKYPVYSEWYNRIVELVKEEDKTQFNPGKDALKSGVPFPV
jgi:phage major head subunit gpT-like protein